MKHKLKPRSGDRRKVDIGPPVNWKERRISVEKRMPEVKEISLDEWKQAMKQFGHISANIDNRNIAVAKTLRK